VPKIVVRECPFTGAIIRGDSDYARHLRRVRGLQQVDRQARLLQKEFTAHIQVAQASCSSVEEIETWLNNNWSLLRDSWNALQLPPRCGNGLFDPNCSATFTFDRMIYGSKMSNSHCAPRGRPENWERRPSIPTGYPGFCSRISIVLDNPANSHQDNPFIDFLRQVGVHCGSGGGGNKRQQYDVKVWLEDWPSMHTTVALAQLAGDDYDN
jgi:hypothetical protein